MLIIERCLLKEIEVRSKLVSNLSQEMSEEWKAIGCGDACSAEQGKTTLSLCLE